MYEAIIDRLSAACHAAGIYEYFDIESINISAQAFEELTRPALGLVQFGSPYSNELATWHGIKIKVDHELSGIAFNLVMSPHDIPSLTRSPRGRIPG